MSHETIAQAARFQEKFGDGTFTIDEFDMFLVDEGLASQISTGADVKSPEYKGFIQQRAAAKRTLNAAAAHLATPFVIKVRTPGKLYEAATWVGGANESIGEVGRLVDRFTKHKVSSLRSLKAATERLMLENPEKPEYLEAAQVLSLVEQEGKLLHAKIEALALHYEAGVEAARTYAKTRTEAAADTNNVVSMIEADVKEA